MKNITKILLFITITLSLVVAVTAVKYKVDPSKCVSCTACVAVCPTKAITMIDSKAVIDPEKCIGCAACVSVCPTKAISQDSTYFVEVDSTTELSKQ